MEKFIKIKEASEILGVSKLTLRNWDKNKKLISYRHPLNNYRVYNIKDIYKILDIIKSSKSNPNITKTKDGSYKIRVIHLKN